MKYNNLIFFAPNINRGGGKYILDDVINAGLYNDCVFIVDSRNIINVEKIKGNKLFVIKPKILSRIYAEFLLLKLSTNYKKVIMMGNLPPLFSIKIKVVIFFQNRLILHSTYPRQGGLRGSIKSFVETNWLRYFSKHNHEFIVQNETTKNELQKNIRCNASIKVIAFKTIRMLNELKSTNRKKNKENFIYIASGDSHKNHKMLIEAWKILASNGIKPRLTLTIDAATYPVISNYINEAKLKYELDIINVGILDSNSLSLLYQESQVLIYPSYVESLGLPLLEAIDYGLEIIAPEVDYIRDIINPSQTFDPSSAKSISRAVERCMGLPLKLEIIKTTENFVKYVCE
jgi:glycosyltransferase involved in cell wall biosynthesis